MANGEYLRGEVYWVCLDDAIGGEEKTGRPAVIVSNNTLNAQKGVVTVAFLTTSGFAEPTRPSTVSPTGLRRRVMCDQLRTIDKSRLDRYDSTLSESELIRVTGALASVMCIPLRVNTPESVTTKPKDDMESLRCEADMWHRMYDLVMNQLVEMRVAADMEKKPKPTVKSALVESDVGYEEEPKPKEEEPKKSEEFQRQKVNINTAKGVEISEKLGIAKTLAYRISAYRKKNGRFVEVAELLEVPKITKKMYERIKDYVVIEDEASEDLTEEAPVEKKKNDEKVNVNTASLHELMTVGFSREIAGRIIHHQKHCSPFKDIDELVEIDGVKVKDIRKMRDWLEV